MAQDHHLNLRATSHPEFDAWRWNDYWVPLDVVVEFKRGVYEMALTELSRYLPRHDRQNRYLRGARSPARETPEGSTPAGVAGLSIHMELPPGATFDPNPQG